MFVCCIFFLLLISVNSLHQLSFSGGGAFGAIEIGILKRVIETNKDIKFDLYTGISAGALNTAVLSYYSDIEEGIKSIETIYSNMNNKLVFDILPSTGVSILNSSPLKKTITKIISTMKNEPVIHTVIGATNIYSGKLDFYNFEEQNDLEKVLLLMSSCAIPGIFPPVYFKNNLYADGGTISNEIIEIEHDNKYLNITFITPYDEGYLYNDSPVTSITDMLCRTMLIILNNFNNPLSSINQNCKSPIGEINAYYVPQEVLKGYNILNFNNCAELIEIGYKNAIHKKYTIC